MATDYSIPKDEYKALLAENAELREYITKLEQANIVLDSDNTELRNDMRDMQMIVSENAKLRELVRGLYMAYIGTLNECAGMHAGLIWDHCDMVDTELAKSHERFEADRHRFDVAMRELGVEVDDG